METFDFKTALGLNRCISCADLSSLILTDDQRIVCEQVKDFGIDEIYFSTDENKSYPAVFLKKVSQFDVDTLSSIARIHKCIWNYQKVLFLYVYNDVEIRIYNCTEKPLAAHKDTNFDKELERIELQRANKQDQIALSKLVAIFSSIAVDTGIVWTLPEAIEIREKINQQKRVDKYLVDSLTKATRDLQELDLTDITIIHKIILRSLFLLYLEDRGATDKQFYNTIKTNAETYFDILGDVDATYRLFARLEEQFNGNVFSVTEGERNNIELKHLEIISKCFINGYEGDGQGELFPEWRLFDFNIIQIELISEIYERFLAETDEKKKKNAGAFYTPPSLVTLILDEVLPVGKTFTDYNVKILDPACGSGIFLVESYKRLLKRYENAHNVKLTDFDTLNKILKDNIYGIEQNNQAVIVAAFSLYLALVDNLDPKTLWISIKLPCLINDPNIPEKKCGNNLFCRDTIAQNEEIESIQFDLVVGNPPFGTENKSKGVVLSESIRKYCNQNGFAKEMVLPFLHKAVRFAPHGKIALIFNTKILTNTGGTYKKFRKWLFQECYVEKIYNFSILRNVPKNFGGQLFDSAIGPVCIVFYQKEYARDESNRIVYYAPKTYIKSNVLEGMVIDNSDVKYLPREECQKPDTKIWKIAMWGGDADFSLISRLSQMPTLGKFLKKEKIECGLGLQFVDSTTKKILINNDIPQDYVKPETIGRYFSSNIDNLTGGMSQKSRLLYAQYYNTPLFHLPNINAFRRIGKVEAYKSPHMLVKEGLQKWNICASFLDRDCSFNSKIIGFHCKDSRILKGLTCYLNSSLVQYYIFICSPSIGIEREEVKKNEIISLPFMLNNDDLYFLSKIYDKYFDKKNFVMNISQMESEINDFIFSKFEISFRENLIIADFANIIKPLMVKLIGKSIKKTDKIINESYLAIICSTLNEFLEGQTIFANGTIFSIKQDSSLAMVKISFCNEKLEIQQSDIDFHDELKEIEEHLWEERGGGIYFRKKLNYYNGSDIYIIRPNQYRFWTRSIAMQDASDLIVEILNKDV